MRQRGRWIAYAALIGLVSGLGAILFDLTFRVAQWGLIEGIGQFRSPASGVEGGPGYGPLVPWLLPLSLVIGGLISGALVFGLAPEAEGHGTDAVIRAFHHLRGRIRRRVPVVKAIASAITIGSGGSAGREGPIAQIGAGFGSFLADMFKLQNRDRRTMMMAGVAGGIGSIFRAPLGAALFAAEVLYTEPEFEYTVLLPGLISAITGYAIYSSYAGWGFLFDVPSISFHQPRHLLLYAVLGVVCAMAGAVYPRVSTEPAISVFKPLRIPRWMKPAIGALALGIIAVFFPAALGMGYGYVQQAIDGEHTISLLLAVRGNEDDRDLSHHLERRQRRRVRPVAGHRRGSGAAFGQAATAVLPAFAPEPAACIMVAMGGFFAGVAKVPFASVIMVMEMTGSYGLLVPSLLVAAIAYLSLPPGCKLYENQLPARTDSPAHIGSFTVDILRLARVRQSLGEHRPRVRTVTKDTSLKSLIELTSEVTQDLFPVVDDQGGLIGEISMEDIRRALLSDAPTGSDHRRRPHAPAHGAASSR